MSWMRAASCAALAGRCLVAQEGRTPAEVEAQDLTRRSRRDRRDDGLADRIDLRIRTRSDLALGELVRHCAQHEGHTADGCGGERAGRTGGEVGVPHLRVASAVDDED